MSSNKVFLLLPIIISCFLIINQEITLAGIDNNIEPMTINSSSTSELSGFEYGLISGFSVLALIGLFIWLTDKRRIKYTGQ
ncbi:MAG: hypothetical protein FK734_11995 [Asgard group archaeon]|nr:hypothetical protein [Asgard group archaeon]